MNITDQLARALAEAVKDASLVICLHEETFRRGAIWNVCVGCGAMWADDESKPIPRQPDWYAPAIQALAAYSTQENEK